MLNENRSGILHENSWERFQTAPFSHLTRSGTAGGSALNGSISSRVKARPIRKYLGTVPFGTVPV